MTDVTRRDVIKAQAVAAAAAASSAFAASVCCPLLPLPSVLEMKLERSGDVALTTARTALLA